MFIKRFSFFILCLLGACACQRQLLIVETEYVSERSLASYWVQTPDPHLNCPTTGQRIIVSWSLPDNYLRLNNLHLALTVRFGNREEDHLLIPIWRVRDSYTYSALNEDYWDRDEIQTYRAELRSDDRVLAHWEHQLWAELIRFDCDEEDSELE